MLTKGAIGNLVNRYKAVLKKCNLINTFGSLAVASMLVLGGAGVAGATPVDGGIIYTNATKSENYKNTDFIKKDLKTPQKTKRKERKNVYSIKKRRKNR